MEMTSLVCFNISTATVESWISSANKLGMKVHIWMQAFYQGGSWTNPVKSGSPNTAFFEKKISEAKKEATLTARKWVKKKMLEETLQKETIVSNIMGLNSSDTSNIDLIRWGFEHLEVHLDSVVYIEL